jgi:hypothetical protein
MGRSRSAPIGAVIIVFISGALIDLVRAGNLVECEPQRNSKSHSRASSMRLTQLPGNILQRDRRGKNNE